jgi:hypothetical protein
MLCVKNVEIHISYNVWYALCVCVCVCVCVPFGIQVETDQGSLP